jgi:hypothetical protein
MARVPVRAQGSGGAHVLIVLSGGRVVHGASAMARGRVGGGGQKGGGYAQLLKGSRHPPCRSKREAAVGPMLLMLLLRCIRGTTGMTRARNGPALTLQRWCGGRSQAG